MSYNFNSNNFRAQCLNVVDGDTLDLFVDQGFHSFKKERFRLLGVNAPELRATDLTTREKAQLAKQFVTDKTLVSSNVNFSIWPLRIETFKADSFGRFLALVYYKDAQGQEFELGEQMIKAGLAEVYIK